MHYLLILFFTVIILQLLHIYNAMKIDEKIQPRKCPRCGNIYRQPPALSRIDGITAICPDCGTREALESMGVEVEEQEKIRDMEPSNVLIRHMVTIGIRKRVRW